MFPIEDKYDLKTIPLSIPVPLIFSILSLCLSSITDIFFVNKSDNKLTFFLNSGLERIFNDSSAVTDSSPKPL